MNENSPPCVHPAHCSWICRLIETSKQTDHSQPALPQPGSSAVCCSTHSSLIGLAVGPKPKGCLYKTPHVLKASQKAKRDSETHRKTDFTLKYCNWKHRKMCKGLAALPQTCLVRWDLHHIPLPFLSCHVLTVCSSDVIPKSLTIFKFHKNSCQNNLLKHAVILRSSERTSRL